MFYKHPFFVHDDGFTPLVSEWQESNTDKSKFRPDVLKLREFLGAGTQNQVPQYDFPDGKDNGSRVASVLRDKGLDITEVDALLNGVRAQIKSEKDAHERAKLEAYDKQVSDKFAEMILSSESSSSVADSDSSD
nr:hypothetical protein YJOPZNRJ_YJOPZNRJ_CDS_0010 [Microvirus sp.]